MRIVCSNNTESLTSVKFRRIKTGPESEMLAQFINSATFSIPQHHNLTVFLEPKVESGYPDAVLVLWDPSIMSEWRTARKKLKPSDFRILQYIYDYPKSTRDNLVEIFSKEVTAGLARLQDADMVRKTQHGFRCKSLITTLAVKDIVAVEAKMSDIAGAITQATRNCWFANKSYVVTPTVGKWINRKPCTIKVPLEILDCTSNKIIRFQQRVKPKSYMTWLINQWIWELFLKDCETKHHEVRHSLDTITLP